MSTFYLFPCFALFVVVLVFGLRFPASLYHQFSCRDNNCFRSKRQKKKTMKETENTLRSNCMDLKLKRISLFVVWSSVEISIFTIHTEYPLRNCNKMRVTYNCVCVCTHLIWRCDIYGVVSGGLGVFEKKK